MQSKYCYLTRFNFFADLAQVDKQLLICRSLDCMGEYLGFVFPFHNLTNSNCTSRYKSISHADTVRFTDNNDNALLDIGRTNIKAHQTLQLSVNSTALPSSECNSESQRGKMIVDGSSKELHVRFGSQGWGVINVS